MKIIVKMEASQNSSSTTFDLQDLGFSEEEWSVLNKEEKMEAIKEVIYDLHDQPFWMLDSFQER